jgi:hypothetical protein
LLTAGERRAWHNAALGEHWKQLVDTRERPRAGPPELATTNRFSSTNEENSRRLGPRYAARGNAGRIAPIGAPSKTISQARAQQLAILSSVLLPAPLVSMTATARPRTCIETPNSA